MTSARTSTPAVPALPLLDVDSVRAQFPILSLQVRGNALAYLDNAATTQKPRVVIDTVERYYKEMNANIHRGVHTLSERATAAYEASREKVRAFLNAADTREIIFVRGCTEAINLVAQSYARPRLTAGDEILVSEMEHHSNIVPWQLVCEQTGATLRVIPMSDAGELDLEAFERLIGDRTRLVAVVHVSNALGTINPVAQIVEAAHRKGVPVLLDGAQAVAHMPVDVHALGCDFYTLSGHKLFGPTGIGVLYGRRELLEAMPPYQGGGDMIKAVRFERTLYNDLPYRFEAGTPNIAGTIGLGAALDYLGALPWPAIAAHEDDLLAYATDLVGALPGVRVIGTAASKASVLSFVVDGLHPHDIGTILDFDGIAIRTGHHCAMPVMDHYQVPATARASFAFYNTREEVDRLAASLRRAMEVMR